MFSSAEGSHLWCFIFHLISVWFNRLFSWKSFPLINFINYCFSLVSNTAHLELPITCANWKWQLLYQSFTEHAREHDYISSSVCVAENIHMIIHFVRNLFIYLCIYVFLSFFLYLFIIYLFIYLFIYLCVYCSLTS